MPKATQVMPKHTKTQKVFATHKPKSPKGPAAAGIRASNTPAENGSIKK